MNNPLSTGELKQRVLDIFKKAEEQNLILEAMEKCGSKSLQYGVANEENICYKYSEDFNFLSPDCKYPTSIDDLQISEENLRRGFSNRKNYIIYTCCNCGKRSRTEIRHFTVPTHHPRCCQDKSKISDLSIVIKMYAKFAKIKVVDPLPKNTRGKIYYLDKNGLPASITYKHARKKLQIAKLLDSNDLNKNSDK